MTRNLFEQQFSLDIGHILFRMIRIKKHKVMSEIPNHEGEVYIRSVSYKDNKDEDPDALPDKVVIGMKSAKDPTGNKTWFEIMDGDSDVLNLRKIPGENYWILEVVEGETLKF